MRRVRAARARRGGRPRSRRSHPARASRRCRRACVSSASANSWFARERSPKRSAMLPATRYASSLSGFNRAASFRRAYAVCGAFVHTRAALCTCSWLSHGAASDAAAASASTTPTPTLSRPTRRGPDAGPAAAPVVSPGAGPGAAPGASPGANPSRIQARRVRAARARRRAQQTQTLEPPGPANSQNQSNEPCTDPIGETRQRRRGDRAREGSVTSAHPRRPPRRRP